MTTSVPGLILNCPHGIHPALPCASCGRGYPSPVVTIQEAASYAPGQGWFVPPRCDHCFCKVATNHVGEGPHRECCKCWTVMAEAFVSDSTRAGEGGT